MQLNLTKVSKELKKRGLNFEGGQLLNNNRVMNFITISKGTPYSSTEYLFAIPKIAICLYEIIKEEKIPKENKSKYFYTTKDTPDYIDMHPIVSGLSGEGYDLFITDADAWTGGYSHSFRVVSVADKTKSIMHPHIDCLKGYKEKTKQAIKNAKETQKRIALIEKQEKWVLEHFGD